MGGRSKKNGPFRYPHMPTRIEKADGISLWEFCGAGLPNYRDLTTYQRLSRLDLPYLFGQQFNGTAKGHCGKWREFSFGMFGYFL